MKLVKTIVISSGYFKFNTHQLPKQLEWWDLSCQAVKHLVSAIPKDLEKEWLIRRVAEEDTFVVFLHAKSMSNLLLIHQFFSSHLEVVLLAELNLSWLALD